MQYSYLNPKGLRLLLWFGISTAIFTSAGAQPVKRLNHVSFNVNEGLLHSQVTDINEDGNGFIWISTGSGVQRFDGKSLYRISESTSDKGIPDDKYVSFFRLHNGNLLLTHSKGISEYNIHRNRFTRIGHGKDSLIGYRPVFEEPEAIWYAKSGKGIYRITKETFNCTDSIQVSTPDAIILHRVFEDRNKVKCLLSFTEEKLMLSKTKKEISKVFNLTTKQKKFLAASYYSTDSALIATQRGVEKICLVTGNSILLFSYPNKNPEKLTRHLVNFYQVSQGIFILYLDKDLYEFDGTTGKLLNRLADLQNGPFVGLSPLIKTFSDSQNNLWLVTESEGLRKLNYQTAGFKYYGSTDRSKNFVKSIFVDKDENLVFSGSIGNGLQLFDTNQCLVKHIASFPGAISPSTVAAILKINKREYLVFIMGELKAYCLNLDQYKLTRVRFDSSVAAFGNVFDYHLNILPTNRDESIIQNSYRIYKIRHREAENIMIESGVDVPIATTTSYLDQKNRLWVGGRSAYLLFDITDLSFRTFPLKENILIRCFFRDRQGKTWMGTEKGIYQLDDSGKVLKIFYKENGLPDENIYAIKEDKSGNLWFSHNKGVSCMKRDETIISFGKNDGLQENEFNTNASFETSDGELFFGGVNGISSFYPDKVLEPYSSSKLLITSIMIGDKEYESDSASWNVNNIELPYHQNSISLQFTAIGNPYQYQYRMIGLNNNWINGNSDNIARYVLPPGKYQFEVSTSRGSNPNNATLKTIAIIVRPPFWKTTWFIALVSIAIIAAIILVTRYFTRIKLKQRILELEQKRALDEERLRISREMHDDIGAGLTQITMMSESIRNKKENGEQLDEIANTSRKLVSNISEIIWSLNPENNSLDEFLGYLREQLHKLLQYSGIEYDIDFPEDGKNVLLNNAQKRNLLLITKEIVHNAVKHSRATRILISCNQDDNSLQFIVKDNGRSFDPKIKSKGNGLPNIRRRITELSGDLAIDSSMDFGTTFTYQITLN